MMQYSLTWIDYSWFAVLVFILVAILLNYLLNKKRGVSRRTVKKISLTPNDWALLQALVNKRRTTLNNLISDILKAYLNNIH